jgi:hypothetical protein
MVLEFHKKKSRINLITVAAYQFMTAVLQAAESIFIKLKQDRQCTYNLASKPVRVTIVAVEKQ